MVSEKKAFNRSLVSVIIPTINSELTIARCLQSVCCQTYPNIEAIVVDNYSSDATMEIAKGSNVQFIILRSERSGAKNHGAKQALGEFILFLDSDMELAPLVVDECVKTHYKEDAIAVSIPEISVASNFFGECRSIERTLLTAEEYLYIPRFFLKKAFFSVGGFDEKLVLGEDADLYARLKLSRLKIGKINVKIKHHEGRLSLKNIISKAFNYGKSLPEFVKKNPSIAVKRYEYMQLVHLRNLRTWLKHPKHFLGFIFMKFIEYIAYLYGVLAQML